LSRQQKAQNLYDGLVQEMVQSIDQIPNVTDSTFTPPINVSNEPLLVSSSSVVLVTPQMETIPTHLTGSGDVGRNDSNDIIPLTDDDVEMYILTEEERKKR
jgi:hypothetical protein